MASPVPAKHMGRSGPLVPVVGFGAMGISSFYGAVGPDAERFQVLDRAYELGARHWDTSDVYGDSEELIGKWFKRTGKRNDVFLATKFGAVAGSDGTPSIRSDPEWVKQACGASLKRLGVDCIDLYYCHRVNKVTPIEKTVEAMVELQKEGKIKYLGVSELSAQSLRRACAVYPITAIQMEYSPFSMEIESGHTNVLATARHLGVALVAYSPLGRGFISGQYKSPDDFEEGDFRRMTPRYSKENFPKNLELVKKFQEIAAEKGCTSGQLCLAWLLAQGDDIFPIPGTKKIRYLEENMGSVQVELSPEENSKIRGLIEATEVHGERAPAAYSNDLFADTAPLSSY